MESLVIVTGDFNADIGEAGGPRGTKPPTRRGQLLITFMKRHNLCAVNMMDIASGPVFTHEGPMSCSTLDYILLPNEMYSNTIRCMVEGDHPLNTSDHSPVSVICSISGLTKTKHVDRTSNRIRWDKLTSQGIKEKYQEVITPVLDRFITSLDISNGSHEYIDRCFDQLIEIIHTATCKLPRSRFVKHVKPFWNPHLRELKRLKVSAYRIWVDADRPRNSDDPLFLQYKISKKNFAKALRAVRKAYENDQILEAVRCAELDRNKFWKILQKTRSGIPNSASSIERQDGKVVHDIEEVLNVWKVHFEKLGVPKQSPRFDDAHFRRVMTFVENYKMSDDSEGIFLDNPFTRDEIIKAISTLNRGKASGFDDLTAEHIVHAGDSMISILMIICNMVRVSEYVPTCCRIGVQVPLFKGKDTCPLDPNNYRGITLLSIFNKIMEILIWYRIETWWQDNIVISELQGACKKGLSCIHTAMLLQETVATALETNRKCLVAYFDVAKAFDTVWIEGLFFQLYELGIRGKTWRILHNFYVNFRCCVRVQGQTSSWYSLQCGIHQGGFLSLLKYTVFINSLIQELKISGFCCKLYKTPSTPVGYADDLATCSTSKHNLDRAIDIVANHGRTWRYDFNAKKSGILVYGEDTPENNRNSLFRSFRLGNDVISERSFYDHVGIRASISEEDTSGLEERLSKARRALNATSGLGIKKSGLTVKTCNIIFWSVVVPIAMYGCELLILTDKHIALLEDFQEYAGRRLQRFYLKTPRVCSFYGLGWIRLERFVEVKKLLFLFTIIMLDDGNPIKTAFLQRSSFFFEHTEECDDNYFRSPTFDLLQTAQTFGLLERVRNTILTGINVTKQVWKSLIWKRAWDLEKTFWSIQIKSHESLSVLDRVCHSPRYLVWWELSDMFPDQMGICEIMAKLLCRCSILKSDDVRLKSLTQSNRWCDRCDLSNVEDVRHLVLYCPLTQSIRDRMFIEVDRLVDGRGNYMQLTINDKYDVLLGSLICGFDPPSMIDIWLTGASFIGAMYNHRVRSRKGIG